MKSLLLLLIPFIIITASCEKEEDPFTQGNPEFSFSDGIIVRGPDTCGFLLSRPSESYKPENLSPQYMVDGMEVKGKFKIKSQNYVCGLKNNTYRVIRITEMQRR